ncbi:hypothetical protein M405DRAFT_824310 [Rhizopogon salebrosus TDB-379]|nr:hypothetical protein M405DRAFT_824310 [Rhizopogon salebrosus TDB-379]
MEPAVTYALTLPSALNPSPALALTRTPSPALTPSSASSDLNPPRALNPSPVSSSSPFANFPTELYLSVLTHAAISTMHRPSVHGITLEG